ncbi:MAG: DUF4249 family protein [Crocinitomicaceae bacterium]|nr:DUF4249 family protein [Crocinitomicaceae bacterium]
MKKILFALSLLAIAYSCQKEIDIDLNEANPIIVIEANYTAEDSIVRVGISLTSNYFGTDQPTTIDAAVVTITDALGNAQNVPNIGDGNFELLNYLPLFNTTYTLNVVYNGVSYTAESDLPSPVSLDEITYDFFPSFFGLDSGYISNLNFVDPADTINNYLVILTRNGEELNKLTQITPQDDLLTDGNPVARPLFSQFFDFGDTIGMELQSVDQQVFNYYSELISIAGGGGGAAPANPTTNWDNDALGFFSAYSNSRTEAVVQ